VDLAQAKELHDLAGLGVHVVDTAEAHDEHHLSLGLDVKAALGASLALEANQVSLLFVKERGMERGRMVSVLSIVEYIACGVNWRTRRGGKETARERNRARPPPHAHVKIMNPDPSQTLGKKPPSDLRDAGIRALT
jgi:hypothetical protein